jgi:hypothetical protein
VNNGSNKRVAALTMMIVMGVLLALPVLRFPETIALTTTAGGACSNGGTPTPITWDFTDGAQGWTTAYATTGTKFGEWGLTTTNAPGSQSHSPSGGNKFFAPSIPGEGVNYFLDQWLISPPFTVPMDGERSLSFWNLQAWEIADAECWESGWIEISNDGGATWNYIRKSQTPFTVNPSYDGNIRELYHGSYPQDDAAGWCSATPHPAQPTWGWRDWAQNSVDLTSYSGQTIQLRFHLFVDNLDGAYGWLIDDVSTHICPPVTPTVNPPTETPAPNATPTSTPAATFTSTISPTPTATFTPSNTPPPGASLTPTSPVTATTTPSPTTTPVPATPTATRTPLPAHFSIEYLPLILRDSP